MTDDAIADLQSRLSYQQASIDELTQYSLQQAQQIQALRKAVEQLQLQLRSLAEQVEPTEAIDPPPPHY